MYIVEAESENVFNREGGRGSNNEYTKAKRGVTAIPGSNHRILRGFTKEQTR